MYVGMFHTLFYEKVKIKLQLCSPRGNRDYVLQVFLRFLHDSIHTI